MSYFSYAPKTPEQIAASAAKVEAKLNEAGALLAANPKPESFPSQAAQLAWYRAHLIVFPKWQLRALEVIFQRQTAGEQVAGTTVEYNNVGFAGNDAEILSSFAQKVQAWNAEKVHKFPTPLSTKQMAILAKRMPRYAGQIINHLGSKAIPVVHVKKAKAPAPKQDGAAS
jgi:hypothetical protein